MTSNGQWSPIVLWHIGNRYQSPTQVLSSIGYKWKVDTLSENHFAVFISDIGKTSLDNATENNLRTFARMSFLESFESTFLPSRQNICFHSPTILNCCCFPKDFSTSNSLEKRCWVMAALIGRVSSSISASAQVREPPKRKR